MAQEIKMSAAGLKAMQEELEYLKTVRRKELAEEIKEARSHGDLSENSEYDEAKNTQGLVENRITELEQMVKNAVVIDESELSVENVSVGTHVTIQMEGEDETEEYDIVGRTEADPLNGKISDESPVGHALLEKAVGATELPQKRRLSSLSYSIRSDVFLMWIQNQTRYNLLFVMKYFRFIYN